MNNTVELIEELATRDIGLAEALHVRDRILVQLTEFESGLELDSYEKFLNRTEDVGWEVALSIIANEATQSWFSNPNGPLDFFIDKFLDEYCVRVGVFYRRVWDDFNWEVQS